MKINRTKLTVESVKLTCRYCEIFRNAKRVPKELKEEEKNIRPNGRYCKGEIVYASTKACEDWECAKFISCDRYKFRIWTSACSNRYQKKKPDCIDCPQGKEISKFA